MPKFKKGSIPWNKGNHIRLLPKGYKHNKETLSKISKANKVNGKKRRGIIPKNLDSLQGKNHWNWKGGIAKIDKLCRAMKEYKQWRSDVFQRDNWTCKTCGKNRCYVTVHHIKAFSKIIKENNIKGLSQARKCKEFWDINNGITLCEECHKLTDNYAGRTKNN